MKKPLFILFLPLFLFSCKNGENSSDQASEAIEMERNNWANQHLNGMVKSIEETPYTPNENGDISEMDSCCVKITEFSDNGFIMKVTNKNKEGVVTEVSVRERTETGKFVSNTRTENGKETWKRITTRDEEGNHLHTIDTDSTKNVTYFYNDVTSNEFNQPVSGKMYSKDSTFIGTWSWKYIDGLRTGRGWIDSTNVQRVNRTGEVNDKGWLSRVVDVRVDEKGDTTTTIENYTYDSFDETGNWTQRTENNDEKPVKVLKRSYTYFEK
jgi:hypothetical protein